MVSQQRIPVFPVQGITVTGSTQTLGEFGLGMMGVARDPLSQIQKDGVQVAASSFGEK